MEFKKSMATEAGFIKTLKEQGDEDAKVVDFVIKRLGSDLPREVLEEMVSCIPDGCISMMASYHHEQALSLSLKGTSATTVTIEPFEEGVAIITTTLEQVSAPLAQ